MPNNLTDLRPVLEGITPLARKRLAEIIEAPFGDSPNHLCDHLCFLRAGAIGQMFDKRPYRAFVIDCADRLAELPNGELDPRALVFDRDTSTTEEIEAAIVESLQLSEDIPELDSASPELLITSLAQVLTIFVVDQVPTCSSCSSHVSSFISDKLTAAYGLLSPSWRKLVAAVVYIKVVARPQLRR